MSTIEHQDADTASPILLGREPLTGGHWVTIDGEHVYLKGDRIVAGPKNLEGKSLGEAANEGKHVTAVHGAEKPSATEQSDESKSKRSHAIQHDGMQSKPGANDEERYANEIKEWEGRAGSQPEWLAKRYRQAVDHLKTIRATARANGWMDNKEARHLIDSVSLSTAAYVSGDGDATLLLASDGAMTEAITLGLPQTHKELPIHYRWNRVTVSGDYIHPVTGKPVKIDPPRVKHWAKNTKLALSRGLDIPVSKVHGLSEKPFGYKRPENTLGAIFDARERDGELEVLAGYFGDDALDIARKNKVSVGVEAGVKDARGNTYDELLTHLCVTPTPVLPGLPTGFVTLSRGEPTEADSPLAPQQKGVEMLDPALKARVTQYLGDTTIPEDSIEVIPLLLGEIDKLKPEATKAATLSTENETLKSKVLALSTEDEPANPRVAQLVYKGYKAVVEADVKSGAYSKATGDLLLSRVEEAAGKPNVMLLSRDDSNDPFSFDSVRELLLKARPGLQGGEQTGRQDALALSREVPGSENVNSLEAVGEAQAKAIVERKLADRGIAAA